MDRTETVSGDERVKSFEIRAGVAEQWHGPRWTPDSQGITYIGTRGPSNIWLQPLSNGPARQLTNFNESKIYAFAWSPDGNRLACVRDRKRTSRTIL